MTANPAAELLTLTAQLQEQDRPEHTYKAVMNRVNALETTEEKCELLRELIAEWERSVDADAPSKPAEPEAKW